MLPLVSEANEATLTPSIHRPLEPFFPATVVAASHPTSIECGASVSGSHEVYFVVPPLTSVPTRMS
jgi:hypothetical protein